MSSRMRGRGGRIGGGSGRNGVGHSPSHPERSHYRVVLYESRDNSPAKRQKKSTLVPSDKKSGRGTKQEQEGRPAGVVQEFRNVNGQEEGGKVVFAVYTVACTLHIGLSWLYFRPCRFTRPEKMFHSGDLRDDDKWQPVRDSWLQEVHSPRANFVSQVIFAECRRLRIVGQCD